MLLQWCLRPQRNRFPVADLGRVGQLGLLLALKSTRETTRRLLAARRHRLRLRMHFLRGKVAVNTNFEV